MKTADVTKKYEIHGDVFAYSLFQSAWKSITEREESIFYYYQASMDRFVNDGYAVEVEPEPIAVSFNVCDESILEFDDVGFCKSSSYEIYEPLREAAGGYKAVANKTFKIVCSTVTAIEVRD